MQANSCTSTHTHRNWPAMYFAPININMLPRMYKPKGALLKMLVSPAGHPEQRSDSHSRGERDSGTNKYRIEWWHTGLETTDILNSVWHLPASVLFFLQNHSLVSFVIRNVLAKTHWWRKNGGKKTTICLQANITLRTNSGRIEATDTTTVVMWQVTKRASSYSAAEMHCGYFHF